MHPFGRASPSVINRLIKAGSLLSPTCSSRDIRAIPSVTQAATPMKPRANLGNRTRQPKGCANRIAKPARLGRTSQNHLMMIILNKTGATTVAQLKATGIQQCNNAKTALSQRFLDTVTDIQNLLPAAFGVSTRDPAALLFAPGGGSPTGGSGRSSVGVCLGSSPWSLVVVFWRVVWYLRGCDRINVAPVVPGHAWPSWPCRGRRGSRLCGLWICRRRMVATRRRMLVFAMVLAWSVLARFAYQYWDVYSESHQANDNERNGDEEITPTKATTARTVTRSPPSRRGMDD